MSDKKLSAAGLPYRPCAGIVLINAQGLVWIGHRRLEGDEARDGHRWQMPQGGIDKGETPAEAATRELYEEVGTRKAEIIAEAQDWFFYDFPPEVLALKKVNKWAGQRQKYFAMRFLGNDSDVDLEVHHPEFDQWRWVEPAELVELIIPFKRHVYEQVVREFSPLIASIRQGHG